MAASYTAATARPAHLASESIAPYAMEAGARAVKLFRNGANQAVRIPKEFELPGTDALIHREGNKLVIEAVQTRPANRAKAINGEAAEMLGIQTLGP